MLGEGGGGATPVFSRLITQSRFTCPSTFVRQYLKRKKGSNESLYRFEAKYRENFRGKCINDILHYETREVKDVGIEFSFYSGLIIEN